MPPTCLLQGGARRTALIPTGLTNHDLWSASSIGTSQVILQAATVGFSLKVVPGILMFCKINLISRFPGFARVKAKVSTPFRTFV